MTMKEKLLKKREETKKRNTVEIVYCDGATGTTTVDKLMVDEAVIIPNGFGTIMVKKYATNYASRVLAELMRVAPAFGLTKVHTDDIVNLNYALEIINIDKINTVGSEGVFCIVSSNDLDKALIETNKVKHILKDVIYDVYRDELGVGFSKVGNNYVPFYQVMNVTMMDCTISSGGIEIEIIIDPKFMCDLDETIFSEKVCSLKRAIENAVVYELLDQE